MTVKEKKTRLKVARYQFEPSFRRLEVDRLYHKSYLPSNHKET